MRADLLLAALLAAGLAHAQAPSAPEGTPDPAAPAAADDLGTLFHSPEERARLDRQRRGEPQEPPATKRAPPVVTGFVQRSDGRNTVWIDGRPGPVASPRAGALFDPRVVREMPHAEPPAKEAGEAKKAEPAAKPNDADAAKKNDTDAARKPAAGAEVKR